MRMKEVCTRTGLTDRAVRLYVESGLVSPHREQSYTGRSSIFFDDHDIEVLSAIAELRRAGFAIGDIKAMLDDPAVIKDTVAARRNALIGEIKTARDRLKVLEDIGEEPICDCIVLADRLRPTASFTPIPKEDYMMRMNELKEILQKRTASLIGTVSTFVGTVTSFSMTYKALFKEFETQKGGSYAIKDVSGLWSQGEIILSFLPTALLLIAAVLFLINVISGKKIWIWSALGAVILSAFTFMILPDAIEAKVYFIQFFEWRYSFWHEIYWLPNSHAFEYVIRASRFIPHIIAAVCILISTLRCSKKEQ